MAMMKKRNQEKKELRSRGRTVGRRGRMRREEEDEEEEEEEEEEGIICERENKGREYKRKEQSVRERKKECVPIKPRATKRPTCVVRGPKSIELDGILLAVAKQVSATEKVARAVFRVGHFRFWATWCPRTRSWHWIIWELLAASDQVADSNKKMYPMRMLGRTRTAIHLFLFFHFQFLRLTTAIS
ncbi:hypothetical protein LSTR_LSTR009266 [Laodelphax striatellus]|uniref:Uncharacterized protein n=1 Tax=Laodelphax striatellus TaxID=195883 RepID=A0A482WH72_LAOST|nr:hypothetical protein LSTR_LSTR009266 [Laodelphax striatellus]